MAGFFEVFFRSFWPAVKPGFVLHLAEIQAAKQSPELGLGEQEGFSLGLAGPGEGTLGEPFLQEPESPAFIEEDLDGGLSSISEDEKVP